MTQQQQHPITPPPELVEQWIESTRSDDCIGAFPADLEQQICVRAAQYGADQELEACCYYFTRDLRESLADELRAHRRPKPKSLKEQALDVLEDLSNGIETADSWFLIQSALEQLDD